MKIERIIEGQPLTFYLAEEQRLAKQVNEPLFFTWVVPPTVIYGQHQIAEQELNEVYCREHQIAVVQRKSGGGCVYADEGNVMVSFIVPTEHVRQTFETYINLLADALKELGYPAVTTEHNDILVNGHKVSGAACYSVGTNAIVHATMLYDVNLEALQHAITPSAEKLNKHAVQSVRQRVKNLKEIRNLGTTQAFRDKLEKQLDYGNISSRG